MRKANKRKNSPKFNKTVHEFLGKYRDRSNRINLPIIGMSNPLSDHEKAILYNGDFNPQAIGATFSTNSKTVTSPFSQESGK